MARRTKVGSKVKVEASHYPEVLIDMGLIGPDLHARNDVWMYGTVTSGKSHHWVVELPAAEATMEFPKNKVERVDNIPSTATYYVVMQDNTIKTVRGLEFESNFLSEDYYQTFEEAKECIGEKSGACKDGEHSTALVAAAASMDHPTPAVS